MELRDSITPIVGIITGSIGLAFSIYTAIFFLASKSLENNISSFKKNMHSLTNKDINNLKLMETNLSKVKSLIRGFSIAAATSSVLCAINYIYFYKKISTEINKRNNLIRNLIEMECCTCRTLTRFKFKVINDCTVLNNDSCAICLEDFQQGEEVAYHHGGNNEHWHLLHKASCFDNYLQEYIRTNGGQRLLRTPQFSDILSGNTVY